MSGAWADAGGRAPSGPPDEGSTSAAHAAEQQEQHGGLQEELSMSGGAPGDIARRQPLRRKGPAAGPVSGPWTPKISSSSSAQVTR